MVLKVLLFLLCASTALADVSVSPPPGIRNSDILQPGATFYVSSGTIQGMLTISSSPLIIHGSSPANQYVFQMPDVQSLWVGQNQNIQPVAGTFNTFIGAFAGGQGAAGSFSTGIGNNSLPSQQGGAENSAFGYGSCGGLIDGSYNICDGANSLTSNLHGSRNTAVGGVNALYGVIADDNVGIGMSAGYGDNGTGACTTGVRNIFIGVNSGFTSSQFNNSAAIGYEARVNCAQCTHFGGAAGSGFEQNVQASTFTVEGGYIQHGSASKSWFSSTVPSGLGQEKYCSDCANTINCISTGTVNNGDWAAVQAANRTTRCN